jgi:V/A-type H+-transporting ATPase subunit K
MVDPMVAAAAAASITLTGIAAAYAIAATGTASIGALAEKPELFGKTMVYVAFAEAIAIYGLLIALMLVLGIGG